MKNHRAAKRQGKSKLRQIAETRGFYIALFTCAVLVGAVSILGRGINKTKSTFDEEAWRDAVAKSGIEDRITDTSPTPVPITNTATPTPTPSAAPVFEATDTVTATAEAAPPELLSPLAGGFIKEYSDDELLYSETMKDWRTHNGLDIAAEVGTQVKAAADGVVEQVYEDDLLGVVVVIGHTGQTQTLYANLQSLDFIKVGRQVKAGDVIGGVGTSAMAESADEPHLHFEILVNKENINPKKMLQA